MIEFRGAGPAEFNEYLDTVLDIYTAAMRPPADQINGRKAIMRNHGTYPHFQCYFAELRDLSHSATPLLGSIPLTTQPLTTQPPTHPAAPGTNPTGPSTNPAAQPPPAADTGPAPHAPGLPGTPSPPRPGPRAPGSPGAPTPGTHPAHSPHTPTPGQPTSGPSEFSRAGSPQIVGFAYGFHGARGQWWHDVVFRALDEKAGRNAAEAWLGDAFELAEIHVHPDFQGKGIGRALINTLCAGRRERSGVLSTHDQPTVARHLYRSMGFTDLLTQFVFPGGYEHYAIVGRPLPLD